MIDLATILPGDPRVVYRDADVLLINARWQDVIGDLPVVDAVITDPPYSERTHTGAANRPGLKDRSATARAWSRSAITFSYWDADDVAEAVGAWSALRPRWTVGITDDVLCRDWSSAYERSGLVTFAPLPFLEFGKQPRLSGDGPASWTCWIMVARQRTRDAASCGSLPGAYLSTNTGVANRDRLIKGGKPLWLMQAIVSDYSREGDLILDPCAGGATTAVAAKQLGRQCIAIEMDPETCAKAAKRLAATKRQLPLPICNKPLTGEQQGFDL